MKSQCRTLRRKKGGREEEREGRGHSADYCSFLNRPIFTTGSHPCQIHSRLQCVLHVLLCTTKSCVYANLTSFLVVFSSLLSSLPPSQLLILLYFSLLFFHILFSSFSFISFRFFSFTPSYILSFPFLPFIVFPFTFLTV